MMSMMAQCTVFSSDGYLIARPVTLLPLFCSRYFFLGGCRGVGWGRAQVESLIFTILFIAALIVRLFVLSSVHCVLRHLFDIYIIHKDK